MGLLNIKIKTKNGNSISREKKVNIIFDIWYKKRLGITVDGLYTFTIIGDSSYKNTNKIYSVPNPKDCVSRKDLFFAVLCQVLAIYRNHIIKTGVNKPDVVFLNHCIPEMQKWNSMDLSKLVDFYLTNSNAMGQSGLTKENQNIKDSMEWMMMNIILEFPNTAFILLFVHDNEKNSKSLKIHEFQNKKLSNFVESLTKRP